MPMPRSRGRYIAAFIGRPVWPSKAIRPARLINMLPVACVGAITRQWSCKLNLLTIANIVVCKLGLRWFAFAHSSIAHMDYLLVAPWQMQVISVYQVPAFTCS